MYLTNVLTIILKLKSVLLKIFYKQLAKTEMKRCLNMNGQNRKDIKPGLAVRIVLKQDQRTGKLTDGIVKDILTNSPNHPHGIKVRLTDGQVGRVKEIKAADIP
jgi:uncharacterized repeat protein (TIGR03833 family)